MASSPAALYTSDSGNGRLLKAAISYVVLETSPRFCARFAPLPAHPFFREKCDGFAMTTNAFSPLPVFLIINVMLDADAHEP
jgi:hypothetical protein